MVLDAANELELATPTVVRQAACDFAAALADTPQFKAYEQAAARLREDTAAQAAMQAFQRRQDEQVVLLQLNALSPTELAELQQLREAFLSEPAVVAYFHAEAMLRAMCQSLGDVLSQSIGLDFGAACRQGCC